jgi:hypothetical protein
MEQVILALFVCYEVLMLDGGPHIKKHPTIGRR